MAPVKRETEREVLVTEDVVHTHGEFGIRLAKDILLSAGNLGITGAGVHDGLAVIGTVLVLNGFNCIVAPYAERLADNDIELRTRGQTINCSLGNVVVKFFHKVVVLGKSICDIPLEVLGLNRNCIHSNFNTLVADLTDVTDLGGETGFGSDARGDNLVLGELVIISYVEAEPVLEEADVETDFRFGGDFRLEVGGREGGGLCETVVSTCGEAVGTETAGCTCHEIICCGEVRVGIVTGLAETAANLREADDIVLKGGDELGKDDGAVYTVVEVRVIWLRKGGRPVVTGTCRHEDGVFPAEVSLEVCTNQAPFTQRGRSNRDVTGGIFEAGILLDCKSLDITAEST